MHKRMHKECINRCSVIRAGFVMEFAPRQLRLRSGTGTKYKILGKYKKGKEVIVLDKTTSNWYEVTAPDGKHGYD